MRLPPSSTLFPYTTLFRSHVDMDNRAACDLAVDYFVQRGYRHFAFCGNSRFEWSAWRQELFTRRVAAERGSCSVFQFHEPSRDRKSTRLNSSHGYISYAVF